MSVSTINRGIDKNIFLKIMKTFNITYEQKGNSFVKGIHVEANSFGEMEEKFNKLNLGTIIGCVIVN